MSTTTIRLPEKLKVRVADAARQAGTTSHNFILEAIAEKADLAERRAEFDDVAAQRYAHIVESGEAISWNEMRSYLEARIAGKPARRPRARKLAK
jgi:predicted transcriptional regulator